jgi:transcription antitermination factor NusG
MASGRDLVWCAVRVRSGCEKKASVGLSEKLGLSVFVPMEKRVRRTIKGKKTVEHPLIPGYLFASGESIYQARTIGGVHDVVRRKSGEAAPVRAGFVDDLRERQERGEFDFTPRKKTLTPGKDARVVSGPFTGLVGKIKEAPANGRATILFSAGIFNGPANIDPKELEEV